jgi:acetyltransferase EpsM
MMKAVVIYGAGGHGKVVLDVLERSGYEIVGFVDDDRARAGTAHCGYPIFADPREAGSGRALEMIVAIGDPNLREQVTERALALGFPLATAVHPSAAIGRDVEIGAGAMILANAAVNPGTRIGRGVIINTAATVDHDCAIGDFAHIAPGARLAGHVRVGERAVVGIGAAVIPGVTIGAAAVVGAGAVVLRDVPARATVAGVPAKRVASRRTRKRGEGR